MSIYKIEKIETNTGIQSDIITLNIGNSSIRVFTHGAINSFHHNNVDVTAQCSNEEQLVKFTEMTKQRGANPLMGPMAGRYGEVIEKSNNEPAQRVAQPGAQDIHGVFAGLPWDLEEINDQENYIQLTLRADSWKNELKNYYYFAALKPESSEEHIALVRLINATKRRYAGDKSIISKLNELSSLLKSQSNKYLNHLSSLINDLVDFAYPGEANITRRVTIENIDENTTSFLDEVWITNLSNNENYIDASGFHTYFNTLLSEIVMPDNFWEGGRVPLDFDDDLPNVSIIEVDQSERLERRLIIIPEGELRSSSANQIIYKDPKTIGIPIAAIENWRKKGNAYSYPEQGRVIKPNETSRIGFRVFVIIGDKIPDLVKDYINKANKEIES